MRLLSLKRYGLLVAVITAVTVAPLAYGVAGEDHPAGSIGAGYAELTEEHVLDSGQIRAFVPTQSVSRRCLVTFSESTFAVAGVTAFCGARRHNGVDGLLVTVLLPSAAPDDLYLALTIYQQFAKTYGQPVLYRGD